MSSDDLAMRVEGLSKTYVIKHQQTDHVTLAELALHRLRHPLLRAERERFEALHDVTFDVRQGEVLGVIGRNGAGKSTLLKILTRITEPTAGRAELFGRVGSLLEVGTGFHPELTGRENVYLNGSILGMSRREIASQFDAIVDFAGVEQFLDTPVKRYSSGMYVRLAFAVAAHLESEILLLDEVLAVGDSDFQAKCFGKVSDLARSGRTVILVSHNMGAVRQFTERAVLLEHGRLVASGPTAEIISAYLDRANALADDLDVDVSARRREYAQHGVRVRINRVRLDNPGGVVDATDAVRLTMVLQVNEPVAPLRVAQCLYYLDGSAVGASFSTEELDLEAGGETEVQLALPDLRLAPGRYYLALSVGFGDTTSNIDDLDVVMETVHFEVAPAVASTGRVEDWNPAWGRARLPAPVVVGTAPVGDRAA